MSAPGKVVIIGHSYLAVENRKQLAALSTLVQVLVLSPRTWHEGMSHYDLPAGEVAGENWRIRFLEQRRLPGLPQSQYLLHGLRRILAESRPDLVHVESDPWTTFAVQAILARDGLDRRIPVVCTAKQNTYTSRGAVADGIKRRIAAWGVRSTARFIAVSEPVLRIYRERLGVPPERFDLNTHLGLDTDLFRPATPEERGAARREWLAGWGEDGALVIGYCGRLERYKGLPELLAAVERARVASGRDLRLLLLGSGSMREELERVALPWLRVYPQVPHARVAGFLQALDLFVMPARRDREHEEHDAHAVIEAMSCGLPCVGSDSGAIPGVLGDAGLIVPAGEVDALAGALERCVAASSPWRAELGARGRRAAQGDYSLEAVARRNMATYRRALEHWAGQGKGKRAGER